MKENPHSAYDYADFVQAERFAPIFADDSDFKESGEDKQHLLRLFVNAPPISANSFVSRSNCVLGTSGCGKTTAVAVILEECAYAGVSYSVFDLEGDYVTLSYLPHLEVEEYEIKRPMSEKDIAVLAIQTILQHKRRIYTFTADLTFDAIEFFIWKYTQVVRTALEKLKKKKGKYAPHLIVLDEAHVFLARSPGKDSRFARDIAKTFKGVSKRGRKYGMGILIASQRAQDLITDLLANMVGRYLMRVTEPADKDRYMETLKSVKNENVMWEIKQAVPTLRDGEAIYVPENNQAYPVRFRLRESLHLSKTPGVEDTDDLSEVKVEELL